MQLTHHIPLFPLGIIMLEGEQTQLHIFEERYKQLISHCEELGTGFGILFANPLNTSNLGSYVVVSEVVKRYPGGELDIIVECKSLFKVKKFYQKGENVLYPAGDVHMQKILTFAASIKLVEEFKIYLDSYLHVSVDANEYNTLHIRDIVNELPLSELEKLEIAKLNKKEQIENYLINYIQYLKLIEFQEKQTFKSFYLN